MSALLAVRPTPSRGSPVTADPAPSTTAELTVDLGAVAANTALLAHRARGELMAVVKADGFGHGAVDVARTALAHGATWLGVTTLDEALALRAAGLRAPVLSWLNAPGADLGRAAVHDVDLAVPGLRHLRALEEAHRAGATPTRVHLHLDTGLARDGAAPSEWEALCFAAHRAERRGTVRVVGVMGHLPCADVPGHPADLAGRARFAEGVRTARAAGLRLRHRHLAATAATLTAPGTHHTLVRVGAGLFGIDPSGTTTLRPTMRLTAPVVDVRTVDAGTGVGYGHAWTAPEATRLGLVGAGYADGLPRVATGRASVLVGGSRRPVVGRISMDQVVVDLGPRSTVRPGDVATVVGDGPEAPTAAEWAGWSDTLEHEVLTGLGSAPARVRRRTLPAPARPGAVTPVVVR